MAFADEAELHEIELVGSEQEFNAQESPDGTFEVDEAEAEDAADAPEHEVPSNDAAAEPSEPDNSYAELQMLKEREAADALVAKEADTLELQSTGELGVAELNLEVLPQANAALFEIKVGESGQINIANQWSTAIVVSRNNGSGTQVQQARHTTLTVTRGDTIKVVESSPGVTFRSWSGGSGAFVSGVKAAITAMPAMPAFTTTSAGTVAGSLFFSGFNSPGSLTSLPAGSFDTSKITTVGDNFFSGFNCEGALTSLPAGSFNTSKITTIGEFFFESFNEDGSLTSLPAGSFNTSKITTLPFCSFNSFNFLGSLTSLPAGSFNLSSVTTVGDWVFSWFNESGALTTLPAGSFNTSKITTVGDGFFIDFNTQGRITSLPTESFNLSKVTKAGHYFLSCFAADSPLASLPTSFKLPQSLSSVGNNYCFHMFEDSSLTRGNQTIPLYFAVASHNTFKNTNITPVSPAAGITVRVNGAPPSYTISYRANGGTGSVASQTVTTGASFTTRANAFSRPGYTFTGWNTAANGSGSTWAASSSRTYQAKSNTTLYAQWKVDPNAKKPTITTTVASVHAGITGINYKKTLKATGTGTITWSHTSGSLPPGLKLSSAGVITGKPTKPGTYNFKVRATNSIGNTTKTFTIKVNNPSISISYQTHVQSVGWQAFKKDGAMSGTSGKALRLEGIKINLQNNTGISGGIRYSTHVQSIGWQKKVSLNTNGKSLKDVKGPMRGTSGKALRLEAITIELTGDLKKHYDIYYRVHAQSVGWMGWARNGQEAGTAGHAYRLEGIQIVLVPKVGGKKPGNTFKGITTPAGTRAFIQK